MTLLDLNDVNTKEELLHLLIEEYGQNVKRLAFTYVKNWSTAEDITQDVFIKCYQSLGSFKGRSSYKTWVYKIAINKSKDVLKSKWYRHIIPMDLSKIRKSKYIDSAENYLIARHEEIQLVQKVLALPTKYREVIIFFYYERMTVKETADLTGIKPETVKTRLKRAKEILRLRMERV